jgi:MFS family permease
MLGAILMALISANTGQLLLMFNLMLMGVGMGFAVPSFLIAVQSAVQKRELGAATATLQFSRSIGGTLGVSVMGAYLGSRLAVQLSAAGLDPAAVSLDSLLDPLKRANAALNGPLREALAISIQGVFVIGLVAAVLGLVITLLTPSGRIGQMAVIPDGEAAAKQPSTSGVLGD